MENDLRNNLPKPFPPGNSHFASVIQDYLYGDAYHHQIAHQHQEPVHKTIESQPQQEQPTLPTTEKRKRSKISCPETWKHNITRQNRLSGLAYSTKARGAVSEKKLGPRCKSNFCLKSIRRACHFVTEDDRQALFDEFWNLQTWEDKKDMIRGLVQKADIKQSKADETSRPRLYSLEYFLRLTTGKKVQVCQRFFCDTFAMSQRTISSWVMAYSEMNQNCKIGAIDCEDYQSVDVAGYQQPGVSGIFDPESQDPQGETSAEKRRKRSMISTPETWKKNIQRQKRLSGLPYVDKKGEKVSERKVGPRCNSNYCAKSIRRACHYVSEEERHLIFNAFWSLSEWDAKRDFVRALVRKADIKQSKSETTSRPRLCSLEYFLRLSDGKRVQVCQRFFCDTLSMPQRTITTWVMSHSAVSADMNFNRDENGSESSGNGSFNARDYSSLDMVIPAEVRKKNLAYQRSLRAGQYSQPKLGPRCSSNFCLNFSRRACHFVNDAERKRIFDEFWTLDRIETRKEYVRALVQKADVKLTTVATGKRRTWLLEYYLKLSDGQKVQVCRDLFCNTLAMPHQAISNWIIPKTLDEDIDIEQVQESMSRLPQEVTDHLDEWINSLPISYYNIQANPTGTKKVLAPGLTLRRVYADYCTSARESHLKPVSDCKFSNVFHANGFTVAKPVKGQAKKNMTKHPSNPPIEERTSSRGENITFQGMTYWCNSMTL